MVIFNDKKKEKREKNITNKQLLQSFFLNINKQLNDLVLHNCKTSRQSCISVEVYQKKSIPVKKIKNQRKPKTIISMTIKQVRQRK